MSKEPLFEEVCNVMGTTGGAILRYEKTYLDTMGRKTIEPQLKISINGGDSFYMNEEILSRMIEFLNGKKDEADIHGAYNKGNWPATDIVKNFGYEEIK